MMKPRSHTTTPYSCKKAPRGLGTALAAWCPTFFVGAVGSWVWTYRGLSRSGFKQICLRALYCFCRFQVIPPARGGWVTERCLCMRAPGPQESGKAEASRMMVY